MCIQARFPQNQSLTVNWGTELPCTRWRKTDNTVVPPYHRLAVNKVEFHPCVMFWGDFHMRCYQQRKPGSREDQDMVPLP